MRFFFLKKNKFSISTEKFSNRGLSLVEALIGIAVFSLVAVGIYQAYTGIFSLIKLAQNKLVAISLTNEQFEIIRNLSYSDVGIQGGVPAGAIPHTRTVNRDGQDYILTTTIRNIDDPFDGVLGGTPNDLSPADYKLAEVEVTCPTCLNFASSYFTTTVGPKNLEGSSTNGALFVKVFDANGLALSGANVRVENNLYIPNILIQDVTNNQGILQIIDTPPGNEAYQIFVSKNGYSSEQTYPTGGNSNPNPIKANANVSPQQVTQASFTIDRLSNMNVSTVTENCAPVPNISFTLSGDKLIGLPNVKKYSINLSTNASGFKAINNLEWDSYDISIESGGAYDLLGINPAFPLNVLPNTTYNIQAVLAPVDPISRIISVIDSGTGLPLSGVNVRLVNTSLGFDRTLVTGRGFLRQTDWSLGGGQDDFSTNNAKFFESTDVDYVTSGGQITLATSGGDYLSQGILTSSTFDTGSVSNFHQLEWNPRIQPVYSGTDSVKFQLATNNDNTTWDFKGPDGTSSTFYTISDGNIHSSNNGNRYLRYKTFLSTSSATNTPSVSDVSFTFTSDCVSPGQVRFSGLSSGVYDIELSKTGYNAFSTSTVINANGVNIFNLAHE